MPGFVDVSNMSDQEIKRMGQRDDDFGEVDPLRRNRRAQSARPASVKFSVSDVWAAACAADRINGGYYKEAVFEYGDGQPPRLIKDRNRHIMMHFLANPDQLLVEDVERGEQCRQFLQSDLTFRTLKGKISEFDSAVKKVLAVSDQFDSMFHKYELAIVACLPDSVKRSENRQTAEQRLQFAQGGFVGKPGDKVQLNIEVLSANYSKEYNIFWIRAMTDTDQPVFFSNKEKFDAGTYLTVQGKVKAHRDHLTQLNYVKVL